jgi:hypothetical protein
MPRIESGRITGFSENGPFGKPGILRGDRGLIPLFSDPRIPAAGEYPKDQTGGYHQMELLSLSKNPVKILVHQRLLRTRLYLISPAPKNSGVIIRKNAEPGRNYWTIPDGNE